MATGSEVEDASVELPAEVQALNRRLAYLEGLAREYAITARVCAVLTERLLDATEGETVVITDEALANSPSMEAGRGSGQVWIRVSR